MLHLDVCHTHTQWYTRIHTNSHTHDCEQVNVSWRGDGCGLTVQTVEVPKKQEPTIPYPRSTGY